MLDLMLLAILERENLYGLEILNEVEIRSNGAFEFKEGSLYPALHRLVKTKAIKSYWQDSTTGGAPRKYYTITDTGKKALSKKKADWERLQKAVNSVVMKGTI